jgi:putative membrane protein
MSLPSIVSSQSFYKQRHLHFRMQKKSVSLVSANYNPAMFVLIAVFAIATYFFMGVGFSLSLFPRVLIAALVFLVSIFLYRRNVYEFWLFSLVATTFCIALGVSFSAPSTAESPLSLTLVLNPYIIILSAFLLGLCSSAFHRMFKSENRFSFILLLAFVINWLVLSINALYFHDWILENLLTVPFVILIFVTHRWFRLSNISYGLIFVYMSFHIVGTHYTYSEVPFGDWLQHLLGLSRNHYDRIVHFAFGFLLAYPFREVVKRIGIARGFWGLYFPIEFVLAFSAIYEIIEWLVTLIFGGDLGIAYLGTQGDEWDAIKDMTLAGLGSLFAMLITLCVILAYNARSFWTEFKESLHVKDKHPLGEYVVQEWQARQSKKQQ